MSEVLEPKLNEVLKEIGEDLANSLVDKVVAPYAKFYAAKTGINLDPFIDGLIKKLKDDVIDKIDGQDDLA